MAFYPSAELDGDPTNWWGPNPAAVIAILKSVGFKRVQIVSKHRSPFSVLGKAAYLKIKRQTSFFPTLQQNRMVFHAWREREHA
jgi:tRNA (mo5U34)-methyltransferase